MMLDRILTSGNKLMFPATLAAAMSFASAVCGVSEDPLRPSVSGPVPIEEDRRAGSTRAEPEVPPLPAPCVEGELGAELGRGIAAYLEYTPEGNVMGIAALDGSWRTMLTVGVSPGHGPVLSPDGRFAAFSAAGDVYLIATDNSGLRNLTEGMSGNEGDPRFSPDGKKLVFCSYDRGGSDIYTVNIDGTELEKITDTQGMEIHARWSPDGTKIAYVLKPGSSTPAGGRGRGGRGGRAGTEGARPEAAIPSVSLRSAIGVVNADGSSPVLIGDSGSWFAPSWSNNSEMIAFVLTGNSTEGTYHDIYIANADGSGEITNVTKDRFENEGPLWSPDDRQIAFVSARDSQFGDSYIIDIDGTGLRQLTSFRAMGVLGKWVDEGQIFVKPVGEGAMEYSIRDAEGTVRGRVVSHLPRSVSDVVWPEFGQG